MNPDKDHKVYLLHILDAIKKIENYLNRGSFEQFKQNEWDQDAVIRNLEIIGETVKHLDADFKKMYPPIPWRKISSLRNVLIHEYFGVDINLVWEIINKNLPELKKEIEKIITPLKSI